MDNNQKGSIGVFDSGLGGISVLKDLKKLMPNEDFIYYGDSANAPYGTKTKEEITNRCIEITDFLVSKGVKAILIACNTATSSSANYLRERYKDIPIIGMEPALKVATKGVEKNNIVVMATPLTLKEDKFKHLINQVAGNNNVIKMPCPRLVEIVENEQLDDENIVFNQLNKYYEDIDLKDVNSIVLGCTHFIFYRDYLSKMMPKHINIVDGNLGTCNHLKNILSKRHELNSADNIGTVHIYNSSKDDKYMKLANKLLER